MQTAQELEHAVLELLDPDEVVALTRELVDAGGQNPGGPEERTVQVLERAGRARGLEVHTGPAAPGRPNVDEEDLGLGIRHLTRQGLGRDFRGCVVAGPTVVMGPGGLNDQAHRVDESVGVDELVLAVRAYARVALRLLCR